MKAVVSEVFQRPKLRNIILYGAFIYAVLQTAFWFYQPYFKLSGLDVAVFGVIFAGLNIVSALSSRYAHLIEEALGKALSLVMLMVLVVASLSLMSSFVLSFSFIFIGLQQFVRGFSKPVISDYVNKIVDSENTSTILSTYSLIGRAFQVLTMPLFGLIADFYTIQQTLALLAFTVFVVGTFFIFLLYSEKVISG